MLTCVLEVYAVFSLIVLFVFEENDVFLSQLKDYCSYFASFAQTAMGLKHTSQIEQQISRQGLTFLANNSHIIKFAFKQNEVESIKNMVVLLQDLHAYLMNRTHVLVSDAQNFMLDLPKKAFRTDQEEQIYGAFFPVTPGDICRQSAFFKILCRNNLMERLEEFIGDLPEFPYKKHLHLKIENYKTTLLKVIPGIIPGFKYEQLNTYKSVGKNNFVKKLKER